MAISIEKKLLTSSFLPHSLIQNLKTEGDEDKKMGEKQMAAIALLLVSIALGAIKTMRHKNYKGFDANPGDGGCQLRALKLLSLAQMDLKSECTELEKSALEIKALVNQRKGSPKEQAKSSPQAFFERLFSKLTVSKEMEYLLHCYLSTVLRTPYQTLPNGVVMTRSDVSKLSMLSDKISALDVVPRRKIVEENQKTLSLLSMSEIYTSATQLTSLDSKEKELLLTMLCSEQIHLFTPDSKYEPKAFGCLFYEVKTVLLTLRENRGVVCFKNIVASGSSFVLLFQSREPKAEFEVLEDSAYSSLQQETPIVVFEAVVKGDKKQISQFLAQHGFTTVMLMQSAKQPPYEPTSTLEDVKIPEAYAEIASYRKKGAEIEDVLELDHVYFTLLHKELKK